MPNTNLITVKTCIHYNHNGMWFKITTQTVEGGPIMNVLMTFLLLWPWPWYMKLT